MANRDSRRDNEQFEGFDENLYRQPALTATPPPDPNEAAEQTAMESSGSPAEDGEASEPTGRETITIPVRWGGGTANQGGPYTRVPGGSDVALA